MLGGVKPVWDNGAEQTSLFDTETVKTLAPHLGTLAAPAPVPSFVYRCPWPSLLCDKEVLLAWQDALRGANPATLRSRRVPNSCKRDCEDVGLDRTKLYRLLKPDETSKKPDPDAPGT